MATITGLSASKYYVNNPIWLNVDMTGEVFTDSFTMAVVGGSETLFDGKYYTYNNKTYIDLSEIIKGLLPEPSHPINPISGDVINNFVALSIYLPSYTFNKTFYRGGEDSQRTNVQVPDLATLSESEKIPVWTGYPSAKYYLDSNGQIIYTNILDPLETEMRKSVTCDPVFLRFLNSKGGYSFWLFDEWELTKKTTKGTIVERRLEDLDLGLSQEHTLTASTRCEERYVSTLRALSQSPEVHVFEIQYLLPVNNPQFVWPFKWTRIYNDGGQMKWNSFDSVFEFDFKFSLNLKTDPSLTW